MTTARAWTKGEIDRIGRAEELRIASRREDGSLSPDVIIWAVAAEGAVYARSAHGAGNGWYRRALERGAGRIRVGGVDLDVVFVHAGDGPQDAIDAAYRKKYARYPSIVPGIVGPAVHDVTIRITPADPA
jgi:hypothetical protein